jgi:hypothetical protein
MIITWCTDPSQGEFEEGDVTFSSFYQYETVTKQFVRIRLELNRQVSGGDQGDTFARFKAERFVGFSDQALSRDLQHWTVDAEGRLCFDGNALGQTPTNDYNVYDCTDVTEFIHRGNPITTDPNFPEGIEPKHLLLIANDTMISGADIRLTGRGASAQQLSEALATRVSQIMNRPFVEITDAQLLARLKTQASALKEEALSPAEESIDDSLDDVNELINDMDAAIANGEFVPNGAVNTALGELRNAVGQVTEAIQNKANVQDGVIELRTAHNALADAVNAQIGDQQNQFEEALATATEAINDAHDFSAEWETIAADFDAVENADSIEEYEDSVSGTEVVEE